MLTELKELQISTEDDGAPKYERLRGFIIDCLKSGQLEPGAPLPSEQTFVEALGIARSTVRQALATLERDGLVRRVHGKGSFIQDDALKKLRPGTDLFALVVPEVGRGFYPSLQSGFELAASAVGSQIIVADTKNSVDYQANVILQLMDKDVGGLAIVPPTTPEVPASQIRVLQKHRIPVVFCHRTVEGVRAPLITFDAREVGRLAGQLMCQENGHQSVAFVASHRGELALASESAMREVLEAEGLGLPPEHVFYGDWAVLTFDFVEHSERVEAALVKMLEGKNPPTAIFCTFDTEAELVYLILNRLGYRVPEAISVIGFGGAQRDRPLLRQLTSITVDESAIGRRAAELLNEMRLGDRDFENEAKIIMPLSVSDGQTLTQSPKRPN